MSTSQFEELKKMFEDWKTEIRLGSKSSTQETPQEKTSIKIQQAVLEEKITQQPASKTVTLKPDPLLHVLSILKTEETHHVRREVVETVTSNPPAAVALDLGEVDHMSQFFRVIDVLWIVLRKSDNLSRT